MNRTQQLGKYFEVLDLGGSQNDLLSAVAVGCESLRLYPDFFVSF